MIKAIAVDKDGTFFKSDNTYDEAYFNKIFESMMERDIKFIIASGNQYAQLRSFFSGKDHQITYIAENGAVTYQNNKLEAAEYFDQQLVFDVLNLIINHYHIEDIVLSGVKSAYVLENVSNDFLSFLYKYYFNITKVSDFKTIEQDEFVKIALRIKDPLLLDEVMKGLKAQYGEEIKPVTSGNDSLDLILPKVNKGVAIKTLLDKWDIQPQELLAFGDANNDIEMLALTPNSYAMAECSPEVADVANYRAPSNDESGVLQVIERYLKQDNDITN